MTEREAYIALNMVRDMGSVTVRRMVERFGSAVAAYGASAAALASVSGIGEKSAAQFAAAFPNVAWQAEMERAAKKSIQLVTFVDADYPDILKQIADPPLVLYVVGSLACLKEHPGIAIIGTRHPTMYGRDMTKRFAYQLAGMGYTIVSGLAVGVDALAHEGALSAKGRTIGVLGGALDCFFPKENAPLARRMADAGGAVISEYPFGREPDRQTFPMRNRIVSGLSKGVLCVEAPSNSGTLITANIAAEQNRNVMAIPGRIDTESSLGCLRLIRNGARMITCVDDVVEELQSLIPHSVPRRGKKDATSRRPVPTPEAAMSPEERMVMQHMNVEGIGTDALIRATGLPAGKIGAVLIALRMKRRIRLLPGGMVALPEDVK